MLRPTVISFTSCLCFSGKVRKNLGPANLVNSRATLGTCLDMCPEKERYMREDRRRLSIFELIPGTDLVGSSSCKFQVNVEYFARE